MDLNAHLAAEHSALLTLVAEVVAAYSPTLGVFVESGDDALDLALDKLHIWVADHHPDWQE